MTTRRWIGPLFLVAAGLPPARPADSVERPNVVLIFADDMGYGDVSSFNPASKIKTPNLDRLASEGMRLTDAHSASGVCTPSRYALLTGCYSWRTPLKRGVLGGFSPPLLGKDRMTLGHVFRSKGYSTACVGKWHLGMSWAGGDRADRTYSMRNNPAGIDFSAPIRRTATSNGFDYFFGIAASLDMPPYVFIENDRVTAQPTSTLKKEDRGGRAGPAVHGWRHRDVMPTFARKTIEWIGRSTGRPFFIYMPLNAPHTPHAPSEPFRGKSGMDVYGDFMVEVDHTIGQVMKAVESKGMTDRTLFIVTSDNGPETNMYARRARFGHDSSSYLLGAKRDNWEGGHRVPFVARWPGVIPPGSRSGSPFCLVDMIATFAEILSIELPEDQGVDSVSILPLLLGRDAAYRRDHAIIHHSSSGRFAIRRGDWKLLLHAGSGGNGYGGGKRSKRFAGTAEQRSARTGPRQLYDMKSDPGETTNLVDRHPDIVEELTDLAADHVRRGRSTPGPRQPNVGYPWAQLDWLDAAERGDRSASPSRRRR